MRLENVYREFAVRCIESGDRPTELEAALEDEVMNRVEDTTVTMHGMVVGAYRDEQTITAGVTYSLDIFAYVNGFETELQLPSWVPDLSAPPALRTHALLGGAPLVLCSVVVALLWR
ncbi:hypothetical protein NUW58_g10895 [Xylaria curta]|uniref:Uncharacterized protein n=1 Tax=Xylaria curta TaxID=42375 RepID=A0ACC1MF79_9PEZI|nr:hypothetical protein NUW58_g10895 [Xylaria curta]